MATASDRGRFHRRTDKVGIEPGSRIDRERVAAESVRRSDSGTIPDKAFPDGAFTRAQIDRVETSPTVEEPRG
jgi:hypothetical protein